MSKKINLLKSYFDSKQNKKLLIKYIFSNLEYAPRTTNSIKPDLMCCFLIIFTSCVLCSQDQKHNPIQTKKKI